MSKSTQTQVFTETIHWIDASVEMPDDGITVLVQCDSPSCPVWIGCHDGDDGWVYDNGSSIDCPVGYWAEIPSGPELQEDVEQ
jgi:hypothetical protein